MTVLVTGACGMVGKNLVKAMLCEGYFVIGTDRVSDSALYENYKYVQADLSDASAVKSIFAENKINRVIHLAALAHRKGESDLSWERYYDINVKCAENLFRAADEIPVLFISTVDVLGFTKGVVAQDAKPNPVTFYAKSKAIAEASCAKICRNFTIFRLSPVYTPDIKRDIQKRYYLKYPNIAYRVGSGMEYEVLSIEKAISSMIQWCATAPCSEIKIIKDRQLLKTAEYIKEEKKAGRAKVVLYIPKRLVKLGVAILIGLTGKNKYTYLLNKAINPIKSK